jgi:Tfp pilus assembly protein PilF
VTGVNVTFKEIGMFKAGIFWFAMALSGAACLAADTSNVPTPDQQIASAQNAILSRNWVRAQNILLEMVVAEPGNADAHNLLAYTYRKQAQPDLSKAFFHYNTALKIDPKHKGAHEYLGEALLMANRPAEAEQHLSQLKAICGTACEEYEDLAKAIAEFKAKAKAR